MRWKSDDPPNNCYKAWFDNVKVADFVNEDRMSGLARILLGIKNRSSTNSRGERALYNLSSSEPISPSAPPISISAPQGLAVY